MIKNLIIYVGNKNLMKHKTREKPKKFSAIKLETRQFYFHLTTDCSRTRVCCFHF